LRGWKPALVVATQELANEVLYTNFDNFHGRDHAPVFGDEDKEPMVNVFVARGKRWRRLRAISSTAFTGKNLKMARKLV
jgi:cytochrome P450